MRKTGKEEYAGNKKMTFMSHGKPKKHKISRRKPETDSL